MFVVVTFALISGCISGSGDDGQASDGGGSNDSSGAPAGGTGGGDTGGTGGGTGGTGGDTGGTGGDTGGTGGNTGGTGGDTGGGTGGTTVYGSLSSLYTISNNENLDVTNCLNPSSGTKTFDSVVLRVIGQNINFVDAAITLTPSSAFATQFDQIFINLSGNFLPDGSFSGTISNMIYTLGGTVVTEALGTITINVFGTSISIEFLPDEASPSCGLSGGFFMTETADPGTGGGGTGGGAGGGTDGGTGGGTGGGGTSGSTDTSGTIIQAAGQFGILTFTATERPQDSGSFQMTNVMLLTHPGHEIFTWWNPDVQATVNVYFGFGDGQAANGQMVFNSVDGHSYSCVCFPTIDLLNLQANFNNLMLDDKNTPPAFITVNGIVSFPSIN